MVPVVFSSGNDGSMVYTENFKFWFIWPQDSCPCCLSPLWALAASPHMQLLSKTVISGSVPQLRQISSSKSCPFLHADHRWKIFICGHVSLCKSFNDTMYCRLKFCFATLFRFFCSCIILKDSASLRCSFQTQICHLPAAILTICY